MGTRIDPDLLSEFKEYGAVGIEKCFNCGNCTAICSLGSDEHPIPRNLIRHVQVGLKDRIVSSTDAWQCYYCGECSDTCPKGAEPAETMMAARRWLTAQYDWTGLAHKFYTSTAWEIGSMVLLGALAVLLVLLFHGPVVTDQVQLNTFAPVEIVHLADWILAGTLLFFVGTNVYSMYNAIMRRDSKVNPPLRLYITEAWHFIYNLVTQAQWKSCADDEKDLQKQKEKNTSWFTHLLMVSGYGLMLVLVVFFLPWFQTDEIFPLYHPQRWLGYYATIVLIYGAGRALWGRVKQEVQLHRFSHLSDWIFPILLLIVSLTGIVQHAFRYLDMPLATYYTYVVHLAFVTPMLVLEVPFGKWAHLYYRPLALYFDRVKAKAIEEIEMAAVPAAAD
jgi:ferredoxin